MSVKYAEHPLEADFREWNHIQNYLEARGQASIHIERLMAYRALEKAVREHIPYGLPAAIAHALSMLDGEDPEREALGETK